jgi:hypothetical protein
VKYRRALVCLHQSVLWTFGLMELKVLYLRLEDNLIAIASSLFGEKHED